MVYSNRFVVCVLVNGQPSKERADGIVSIPFGSEYALRFRNKNNRRAVAKFTIDGENVSGNGYVIPAHSAIDIKRHSEVDRAFRFVDLDSGEAIEYGKNGPNTDGNKGVIEVKFFLEKEKPIIQQPIYVPQPYPVPYNPWNQRWGEQYPKYPKVYCSGHSSCSGGSESLNFNNKQHTNSCVPQAKGITDGVTVEGNYTGQTFSTTNIELEEDFVLIRCILKGCNDCVEKPKQIIRTSVFCTNCGNEKVKEDHNFCGKCGHKL